MKNHKKYDIEASVYVLSNLAVFLVFSILLEYLIFKYINHIILKVILPLPVILTAAYLEEHLLSGLVNGIISLIFRFFKSKK